MQLNSTDKWSNTNNTTTLIDHIIGNHEEMYYQWGIYDPLISDHCMVYTARKKGKDLKMGRECLAVITIN